MTTADRIRNRRIELGLTQLEVSKRLGLTSKAAVCKVEKQGDDVTLKNVEKFAKALDCSVLYLMGWEEDNNEKNPETDEKTEREKRFIELFEQLDENQQRLVQNMIEAFLSKQ